MPESRIHSNKSILRFYNQTNGKREKARGVPLTEGRTLLSGHRVAVPIDCNRLWQWFTLSLSIAHSLSLGLSRSLSGDAR